MKFLPEVPSDKLVERQGITYEVNSTTPFTGSTVNYDKLGYLEQRENYKDGKILGLTKFTFHTNHKLKKRENYKDGKRHGLTE